MMTKSDFEVVAGVFLGQVENLRVVKGLVDDAGLNDTVTGPKSVTLETMAYNMVQKFKAMNDRFNHVTFYEACGFYIENNYPRVFKPQG
jgi:hypothetical protein